MKYQRCIPLGYKDKKIKKFEFEANTQFLYRVTFLIWPMTGFGHKQTDRQVKFLYSQEGELETFLPKDKRPLSATQVLSIFSISEYSETQKTLE